jgi:hypothetical protein
VIRADIVLDNHSDPAGATVDCSLNAGGAVASGSAFLPETAAHVRVTIPIAHIFGAAGSTSISCTREGSGSAFVIAVTLIATEVVSVSRVQIP